MQMHKLLKAYKLFKTIDSYTKSIDELPKYNVCLARDIHARRILPIGINPIIQFSCFKSDLELGLVLD